MANVHDAMKKREAELAAQGRAPGAAPEAGAAPAEGRAARPRGRAHRLDQYSASLVVHYDRTGRIAEQYRDIRNALATQHSRKRFCALVTSARPREGKTVTCLNLALVLAEDRDRRTLVVDFHLRRPRVAALLRTAGGPGMAEVLRGAVALAEVIQPTVYPNLFVIPSGLAPSLEVALLLKRPELDRILEDLRRSYDYVLMDTPAVSAAPDVGILGRAAPEALLVVRAGKTRRPAVAKAIALLHAMNVKPVGLALTHGR